MKLKSKTWSHVIFKINNLSGTINKNFDSKLLNNKANKYEVELILTKIEYETENFRFIRYYTHWKYIVLSTIIILVLIVIVIFSAFQEWKLGIGLLIIIFLLSILMIVLSTRVFERFSKKIKRIIKDNIHLANEIVFLKKRLFMMACNEFKFIAIYIIPLEINFPAIIHNLYIVKNKDKNDEEERPSIQQILERRGFKLDGNKYSNFKNNYITDFNI